MVIVREVPEVESFGPELAARATVSTSSEMLRLRRALLDETVPTGQAERSDRDCAAHLGRFATM